MDYNQFLTVEVLYCEGETFNSILCLLKTLKSKKQLNQHFIFPIFQSSCFKEINSTVTETPAHSQQ